jgi:hypothetical protein
MTKLPDPGDALRIAAFLHSHPGWSAFWDKHDGVWRVAEDDPSSGLHAESADADEVIGYMATYSERMYHMITVNKQLLSGTPDDVRATVEDLARDQGDPEYLAGTWLRELAVKLAACDGLTVSVISYDDTARYELEVTLVSAPHHDPIVIGRSRTGDQCQITLERWLRINSEPDAENAVNIIHAILAVSAHTDQAGIIDTTEEL